MSAYQCFIILLLKLYVFLDLDDLRGDVVTMVKSSNIKIMEEELAFLGRVQSSNLDVGILSCSLSKLSLFSDLQCELKGSRN